MPSHLIDELQRRYLAQTNHGQLLAIVMHGSAASIRQDALSDLDLLLITDQTTPAFHALWQIDGTPCDLHVSSLTELLFGVKRDIASNNNFALRAFSTGTLLFETNSAIADHQRASLIRWQAGPAAPSAANVYAIRQAAVQTDLFLTKCSARASSDLLWHEVALARSGTFLTQLVDSYCRLHRLWSNAFWILVHEKTSQYQPVVDLIRRFLTPDPKEKIDVLRILCRMIIAIADQRDLAPGKRLS